MAKDEGFDRVPYRNLFEYKKFKTQGANIMNIDDSRLKSEADEEPIDDVDSTGR